MQCTVNGQQRQLGRTSQMITPIADLIAEHLRGHDAAPRRRHPHGSTPEGVGPLSVGDEVAVSIEGIGTLTNKVVKRG
ncbi:fumarylacetoacetate hydrolase family protein [Streptomyces sp. KL116D]|uniref:fumarylacetoacetate hydrolase family protein n=1 Tax=Streptomyces sp. KL116D TaxID=3045152 RepID=UPI0035587EE8